MTRQTNCTPAGKCVRMLLSLCLLAFLPVRAWAQGIPFIRNFSATEYKAHNQNFDIITGSDGTVYVANFEGLLYYDNAQWHIIYTPGVTRITSVFRDSRGIIWTGGYNYIGYVKVDEQGRLRLFSINQQQTFQGEVQWIWEKEGRIYFKVSDERMYTVINDNVQWAAGEKLPEKGFSVFMNQSHINQVQQLDGGVKALATTGYGVIFVDEDDKEIFRVTEANGLCSNNVNHITYNGHGFIWGATDNGIFAISYPSIYTRFTSHEGLRGEVLSLAMMNNQLYAGTLSGLYMLDGMEFKQSSVITHACWQLLSHGSSLYAATANGVYRVNSSGDIQQLTTANTLSLLMDTHHDNAFYTGETDGIFYYTPAGKKKVSDIEKVVKMMYDKNGSIWFQNLYGKIWHSFIPYVDPKTKDEDALATLVMYNDDVLPVYTHTTTPFAFPMFSYADDQGVLWLTDNNGRDIYAFRNGSKDEKLSNIVYPLMDYSVRAMLHKDKTLWMGGDKGINVVDYSKIDPESSLGNPRLLIRSVLLRGDSVLWGGYGKQLETLQPLSSDENNLTFTFSIVNPSLLLAPQYRTRMNGGKWSAWTTDNTEDYSSLHSGNYTFEVQARDAFGRMSDVVTVTFTIKSPFYLRWYMLLFYFAFILAGIYQLMRWRVKRLEKEKRRLEDVVQKRTAEVVRLEKVASVAKLTQGLIDRILNPLNYINNFAKLSEGLVNDVAANIEDEKEHMDPDNYEDTADVLDMLKGNLQKVGEHGASTSRTLKAMEEMLKDRSGGIVEMNLTVLLQQNREMLQKYYEKEIGEYHIKTVFELPEHEIRIKGNAEQLSKTFMSLLGNSVYAVCKKYRQQAYAPEISTTVEVKGKHAYLHFRDNGIGIESTILDKIFDPFFTTKTTGEASGIGLYLSREIVQNLGGDISVQSQKDVFTEFTITLPTL